MVIVPWQRVVRGLGTLATASQWGWERFPAHLRGSRCCSTSSLPERECGSARKPMERWRVTGRRQKNKGRTASFGGDLQLAILSFARTVRCIEDPISASSGVCARTPRNS